MKNRSVAIAGSLMFAATFGGLALAYGAGVRWNVTPSVPTGLYMQTGAAITTGQLVTACLDPANPAVAVAIQRNYLPPGRCAGGIAPVLKPIVAMAGDRVRVGATGLTINGRALPGTRALATDPRGRPLPHAPTDYIVPAGMVVLAVNNPNSFDSRYIGPIASTSIESAAKPLLLF